MYIINIVTAYDIDVRLLLSAVRQHGDTVLRACLAGGLYMHNPSIPAQPGRQVRHGAASMVRVPRCVAIACTRE